MMPCGTRGTTGGYLGPSSLASSALFVATNDAYPVTVVAYNRCAVTAAKVNKARLPSVGAP
jgi:hypothetical protein